MSRMCWALLTILNGAEAATETFGFNNPLFPDSPLRCDIGALCY